VEDGSFKGRGIRWLVGSGEFDSKENKDKSIIQHFANT
jgi:hypothetical protein